jgi:hypothetical protein
MSTAKSNQGEEKKGGARIAGIIILIVIILALVGVIVFLLLRKPAEEEKRNVVVTPENVNEVIQQMDANQEEKTPVGYYTVTQNFDWHFSSGDAVSSDAYVENVKENTHAVYFDLFLSDDTENAIYKSPVIPVGSNLQDIALDTKLDAGTYECIAVYHIVDDEQNTLSTLRVTVNLIIDG